MRGLDANVLVRYVTQDDKRQSALATKVIEQEEQLLVIQPVTLCELVWVLSFSYGFGRDAIASVLERILRTAQFEIVDKDTACHALASFVSGKGDFADYYIGEANSHAGAETTLTFDKSLRRHPSFELLVA